MNRQLTTTWLLAALIAAATFLAAESAAQRPGTATPVTDLTRLESPTGAGGGVAVAGTPRIMTYQGLAEKDGTPIDNQSMVVEVRAYNALVGGDLLGTAVSQTLAPSAVSKGVFSAQIDADTLALPDNAAETYLEVAICSPAPCAAVPLSPRTLVTHAALAVSARNLGGAARAEANGSLVVESNAAASGVVSLRSTGATEAMLLSASDRTIALSPNAGTGSLKMQALSPTGDRTEAFLDDSSGEMTLSKLTVTATAAVTTNSLQFNMATGEVAAFRDTAPAPLRLTSKSLNGDETYMLLDDASSTATFSKEFAAANTAGGVTPPPKLTIDFSGAVSSISAFSAEAPAAFDLKYGSLAAMRVDVDPEAPGEAVMMVGPKGLLLATEPLLAEDSNVAAALSDYVRLRVFPAIAAESAEGGAAAVGSVLQVQGVSNNVPTTLMEIDLATSAATFYGTEGVKAGRLRIDSAIASNTAGLGSSAELVVSGDVLELKVDDNTVDRWTGLGSTEFGSTPNRISGSPSNSIAAGKFGAVIAGGGIPEGPNIIGDSFAVVGGGRNQVATGWSSVIGGGYFNTVSGRFSTVGGGESNTASGEHSTVGGGFANVASGIKATVTGGSTNTASGSRAVAGGGGNTASGAFSTVPGGNLNLAVGNYSLAAGRRANANHAGAFVWGDSTDDDVASSANNQFTARTSGGARFYSDSALTTGVTLAAGGGSWTSISDKDLKENFAEIDKTALLERLSAIPVTSWNYKSQDASIRHIGPMGQDFAAAFGVGDEPPSINTVDADGVALAAIQGLYEIVQEKDCEVEELRSEIENLKELVKALAAQNGGGE